MGLFYHSVYHSNTMCTFVITSCATLQRIFWWLVVITRYTPTSDLFELFATKDGGELPSETFTT